MSRRVLLVDDEELVVSAVARGLRLMGHTVSTSADGQEALEHLERERFDVLLSDVWMPRMDGWQLLEFAKARHPELVVILFSGLHFPDQEARAQAMGAVAFLTKPLTMPTLRAALDRLASD